MRARELWPTRPQGTFLFRLKLLEGLPAPPIVDFGTGGIMGTYGTLLVLESEIESHADGAHGDYTPDFGPPPHHAVSLFVLTDHACCARQVLPYIRCFTTFLAEPRHRDRAFVHLVAPLIINCAIVYDAVRPVFSRQVDANRRCSYRRPPHP